MGWQNYEGRREGILRSLRALRRGRDGLGKQVSYLYLEIKTWRQRLRDKEMGAEVGTGLVG